MDPRHLRNALGRYATGVAVITCCDVDGAFVGLTANSFAALSLAPPLVLWSLREVSLNLGAFGAAPTFAINVLAESQVEISRLFAAPSGRASPRVLVDRRPHGAPCWPAAPRCSSAATRPSSRQATTGCSSAACWRAAKLPLPPLVFPAGHYHLLGESCDASAGAGRWSRSATQLS